MFISGINFSGTVLVHCIAGMSRSVTVTAAYLLSIYPDLTWRQAIQAIRGNVVCHIVRMTSDRASPYLPYREKIFSLDLNFAVSLTANSLNLNSICH